MDGGEDLVNGILFGRFFAKRVCTACSRTSYKIVAIPTLNKYLYTGKSEIKVNIQGVSRLEDITAAGDFLGLSDQKSSHKHLSDFGRLRSYERLKLRI